MKDLDDQPPDEFDDDEAPRRGVGRPPKYRPEMADQARKLCLMGATDDDLGMFFNVDERTIKRWRLTHDEFAAAVKIGKDACDDQVERSLYTRAMGYERDAVKVFMPAGADAPVYAPYREAVTADTVACIFWLKNRRKETWRDTSRQEQTGPDGLPIQLEVAAGAAAFTSTIRGLIARTTTAGVPGKSDGTGSE